MLRTSCVVIFVLAGCTQPSAPPPQPQALADAQDPQAAARQQRQVAKAELNTRMRALTTAVLELSSDVATREDTKVLAATDAELLGYIDTIDREARATAHLPLGDPEYRANLDGFLAELGLAREQVRDGRPGAHVQGTVIGACVYCHELRDCRGRVGRCPDVRGL